MKLKQRISAFVQLSALLQHLSAGSPWPGYSCGINENEYNEFLELLNTIPYRNPWFTEENIKKALGAWRNNLTEASINTWLEKYPSDQLEQINPKKVGLVLAGNIPLVGMHDVFTVLISGHIAVIKLSSDDNLLLPALLKFIIAFEPEFESQIVLTENKLPEIEAVIATGSNNSSRYFEYYFAKYPHIIRKNRTSIALITENTSEDDLKNIGKDIFDFFGLGCRNVTHVLFPEGYELDRFFKAIYDYNPIVNHNKYANNYDYHKALYLLNQEDLLDNGFLLLRKSKELPSPLGTLHYQYYKDLEEARALITLHKNDLQCVVDDSMTIENAVLPGNTQNPNLWDYADGVDTMAFLLKLKA